ncbi:hypothetical protein [Streptomyces sp. NPDC058252]|uniref:hypothetical protein n=1 Tax=Streptomyces sp. NPDC058252 TaxID=3346405 RepID=UPI0036E60717
MVAWVVRGRLGMAGARRVAGCSCLAASSVQPARSGGRGRQVLVGDFSPEDCDDYRAAVSPVTASP